MSQQNQLSDPNASISGSVNSGGVSPSSGAVSPSSGVFSGPQSPILLSPDPNASGSVQLAQSGNVLSSSSVSGSSGSVSGSSGSISGPSGSVSGSSGSVFGSSGGSFMSPGSVSGASASASGSMSNVSSLMFPSVRFSVPKLTKQSYVEWKRKIDAALFFMQATEYIQSDVSYEQVKDDPSKAHKFMSAYTLIDNEIAGDIRQNLGVLTPYSPYHLYKRVVDLFEPKNAASRLRNRRRFFRLTCSDPRDVGKFCTMIEQMCSNSSTMSLFTDDVIRKIMGVPADFYISEQDMRSKREFICRVIKEVEDTDKMAVLLGGIPDVFEVVTTIIENDPTATYNKSKDMLIHHAQKIVQETIVSSERVNAISSASSQSSNPSPPAQSSRRCTHCNRDGHLVTKCFDLHPELSRKGKSRGRGRGATNARSGVGRSNNSVSQSQDDVSNFDIATLFLGDTDISDGEDVPATVNNVRELQESGVRTAFLDSGASRHMTGPYTSDLLSERRNMERPVRIHFPNGQSSLASEQASISFSNRSTPNGSPVVINDVIVSESLVNTVFSVARICDMNSVVVFSKNEAIILRKNDDGIPTPVMRIPRVGNLYKVDLDVPQRLLNLDSLPVDVAEVNSNEVEDFILKEDTTSEILKLHYKLGHVNEYALQKAIDNGSFLGISKKTIKQAIGKCVICDVAKMRKRSCPKKSENRAKEVVERFVADTSGLQSVPTPSGVRGFSVIVDDMSGYCDVRLIKHKSEVQDHISLFKAYAENLHEKKLKFLRTDNAKEYLLKKEFVEGLENSGVKLEQCCEYEHAQNGLAEREIGVLARLCQANLEQAGAPKWLWGEAMRHASIQRVLQPRKRLNFKTPFEIWHKKVPKVEMLKPWGCLAIAYSPKEKRKKLEPIGIRCIYLGIDASKKGYRLLHLKDKKVIVTPNATFYENLFPYKLKTLADYIVSRMVPGGVRELSSVNEKESEEEQTEYDIPFIPSQEKKQEQVLDSQATQPESVQDVPVPSTPPLVLISNRTPAPTPPLVLNRQSRSNSVSSFVTAGRSASHNDEMVSRLMRNFNPNSRRRPVQPVFNGNVETTPNSQSSEQSGLHNDIIDHIDDEYCYMMKEGPLTFKEAMSLPSKVQYNAAAERELEAFKVNDVYELVPRNQVPSGDKVFTPRWVFGKKWDDTYKARLTVDGSRQKKGIHYFQSRAETLSLPLLRFMLTLIVMHKMKPFQFDVPNAFLQSPMDTPVFLSQPLGYIDKEHPDWVWKLKKCVYGLKQASLRWRSTFHTFITTTLSFREIGYNTCAYTFSNEHGLVAIMLVYVDDFILACNSDEVMEMMVKHLVDKFRVKPLGVMRKYLGMDFKCEGDSITVNQPEYILKILDDLNFKNLTPLDNPQPEGLVDFDHVSEPYDSQSYASVIGKLIWLSVCTRPDIMFYVSYYASFISKPTVKVWNHVVHLLRYLNTTKHMGIVISAKCVGNSFKCYTDAGHANECMQRRSVSGSVFFFLGTPIFWNSKKIHSVVKSAMEAEFIAMSEAAYECKYIQMICSEVFSETMCIDMCSDNSAAISVSNGIGQIRKVKHLHTRFFIIRQMVDEGAIELRWVPTKENIADIFTKHIGSKRQFISLRDLLLDSHGAGGC